MPTFPTGNPSSASIVVVDADGTTRYVPLSQTNIVVTTPTGPDVIVQAVTMTPASPTVGQEVTFSATVKNQGNAAAPGDGASVYTGVSFSVDGVKVNWATYDLSLIHI